MVMRDLYESNYGIFEHRRVNRNRPLASVAFHLAEDINEHSPLQEAMKSFIDNDIGNLTKMSLLEYLELPVDIISMINDICAAKLKSNSQTLSEVEKQMKDLGK